MDFLSIAIGILAGIPQAFLNKAVTESVFGKLKKKDLRGLMEDCLGEAVKKVSRPPDLVLQLENNQLAKYFEENEQVEPALQTASEQADWRAYLKPFTRIINVRGRQLTESEHLKVVWDVLSVASESFRLQVAQKHPAFEQLLLEYDRKLERNDQRIMEMINDVPSRTVAELGRVREPNKPVRTSCATEPWRNPFSVVAADDLDLNNPDHVKEIRELFVARYTDLPTVKKHFNTILEGQRGTGKTMILKYLGFETQIMEWTETGEKTEDFLCEPGNFIGIYSKLPQGVFDKADLDAVETQQRRERIFEHRLVLHILYDTLQTMQSVIHHFPPPSERVPEVRQALQAFLRPDEKFGDSLGIADLLRAAQAHISLSLIPQVDEHLVSVAPGSRSGPTDFNPWLTLSGQLVPLLRLLKKSSGTRVPFFLMLDDFDVLEPYQQSRIFRIAAQREFSIVCFKFGVMVLGRKVSTSGPGRTFRAGDDYDPIDLDWTQGGLHDKYKEVALEIAEARLAKAGWPSGLGNLLPPWPHGEEIMDGVREGMKEEWDAAKEKPTVELSNYISKYGNARFFQTLRRTKTGMRYAGLDYVLMVSSGIFRQFLETCRMIFDRAYDKGWSPVSGGVSPEIQDDAIREYSAQMVYQFSRTSGDAQALLSGDIEITSQHMITLIESLCDVFYSRLHTPGHRDPEIICVAIRDDLTHSPAATYLNVAVRESILHRFEYKPKAAGGPPLPAYMLNRRLGPRRDLSIRRMQGRIEISSKDILLAVSNRDKFLQTVTRADRPETELEEYDGLVPRT